MESSDLCWASCFYLKAVLLFTLVFYSEVAHVIPPVKFNLDLFSCVLNYLQSTLILMKSDLLRLGSFYGDFL